MNIQNPCGEMLVTSTGEVLAPCGADLIEVLLDQDLNLRDLLWFQPEVRRQLHGGIDPELRLTLSVLNMNVPSSFLAGKEVEPKSLGPEDRRTHETSIAQ
jgi:hypothetical protein